MVPDSSSEDSGERSRTPAERTPWWRRRERREKAESYLLSGIVHALLLLLLALVTLGGGGGTGDAVGEGATGSIARAPERSALSAEALEKILQAEEVKPLEVALPSPRKTRPRVRTLTRTAPTRSVSAAGVGGGIGGGIGAGIGKSFGDYLGILNRAGFDCVFVIDASGSMTYVIDETRDKIARLVAVVQRLVPVARVGLVVYRDRGEQLSVRRSDLTFHGAELESFLAGIEAGGGGDWEEGIRDGLEAAIERMSWRRRSKKIIVLVASSPPHAQDWPEIESLAGEFRRRGGVISTIDVSVPAHAEFERAWHRATYGTEPETISALPSFYAETRAALVRIAKPTGGSMVALEENDRIVRELMVAAFGPEWQSKVGRLAKDL